MRGVCVVLGFVLCACGDSSSPPRFASLPDIGPLSQLEVHLEGRCALTPRCPTNLLHTVEVDLQMGWADRMGVPVDAEVGVKCCVDDTTKLQLMVRYFEGAGFEATVCEVVITGAPYVGLLRASADLAAPYLDAKERSEIIRLADLAEASEPSAADGDSFGRYNLDTLWVADGTSAVEFTRRHVSWKVRKELCDAPKAKAKEDPRDCRIRLDHELRGLPRPQVRPKSD